MHSTAHLSVRASPCASPPRLHAHPLFPTFVCWHPGVTFSHATRKDERTLHRHRRLCNREPVFYYLSGRARCFAFQSRFFWGVCLHPTISPCKQRSFRRDFLEHIEQELSARAPLRRRNSHTINSLFSSVYAFYRPSSPCRPTHSFSFNPNFASNRSPSDSFDRKHKQKKLRKNTKTQGVYSTPREGINTHFDKHTRSSTQPN